MKIPIQQLFDTIKLGELDIKSEVELEAIKVYLDKLIQEADADEVEADEPADPELVKSFQDLYKDVI